MDASMKQSLRGKASRAGDELDSMIRIAKREGVDTSGLQSALHAIESFLVDLSEYGRYTPEEIAAEDYGPDDIGLVAPAG